MAINYNRIPVLAEVIKSGSISEAARNLGLTQSAISQQIFRFEEELNVQLLERNGRNVRATEAGLRVAQAADMLYSVEGFVAGALNELNDETDECLEMFCFRSASLAVLPRALQIFNEKRPKARIALREVSVLPELIRTWQTGAIELGLVHEQTYFAALTIGEVVRTVLMTEPMGVLMRRDHPLAKRDAVTLDELRYEYWVAEQNASIGYLSLSTAAELAGFSLRVRCQSSALEVLASLVGAGGGIALVPTFSNPARTPETVLVPLAYPQINRSLVSIAPVGPKSKAAQVMQAALAEVADAVAAKYKPR